jgi:hypothetical protein
VGEIIISINITPTRAYRVAKDKQNQCVGFKKPINKPVTD